VEQPPETFANYAVLTELGRGTTGVVYEARDTALNRLVALKVLVLASESERPVKSTRFMRECQVLAWLTAKLGVNIPTLHGLGVDRDRPFCVRELVQGSTLEQAVARGTIDLRAGLGVLAKVAGLIQWVHDRRFVHRNLSAENVLIDREGTPKLIGFGRVGLLAGSDWLPPGAAGVSPEIDVWALQKMLGWLCAALGQPIPPALEQVRQPGSVASPGAFAEAVSGYLRGERA
jgi:serine/threonine-protein kinase